MKKLSDWQEQSTALDLSSLIGKNEKLKRDIKFDGISKYSFLYYQLGINDKGSKIKDKHAQLINVVIGN